MNDEKNNSGKMKPWLYVVALFFSQLIVLGGLIGVLKVSPEKIFSIATPIEVFIFFLIGELAAFLVVLFFSKPKSYADFADQYNLEFKNINYFSLITGIILGGIAVSLVNLWCSGSLQYISLDQSFSKGTDSENFLFIILLLAVPFFEEVVIRGFLYRAFRKSYGMTFSIVVIIAIAVLTHSIMRASIVAFFALSALQIILCLWLEKTKNLWNCIFCHLGYNAVSAYVFLIK